MDKARRATARDFIGQPVHDLRGERLGDLADVVFDADSGHIVYGVLSVGGVLGVGEKLFAVPWEMLRRDDGRDPRVRLDASLERLKVASGFDKDNWPDDADAGFTDRTHTNYS